MVEVGRWMGFSINVLTTLITLYLVWLGFFGGNGDAKNMQFSLYCRLFNLWQY